MPKIFHVNWFRTTSDGKFLWPGYGDNIRVLDWILRRCDGDQSIAVESPIGYLPKEGISLARGQRSLARGSVLGLNNEGPNHFVESLRFDQSRWSS